MSPSNPSRQQNSPSRGSPFRSFPYGRFAFALGLGVLGGLLFSALRLPLPWMLGSMTVCTIGSLFRMPIAAPSLVRPPMTAIIGVLLGSGFSPALLGHLGSWTISMLGLLLFVIVAGAACVLFLRKVARLDVTTAYFAAMPGGLVEMVILGEQRGGDARVIALMHSARVLLVVMTLPFLVQALAGAGTIARSRIGISVLEAPWTNHAWLIGTAIAGVALGRLLRLRAAFLLGPMLASAATHLAGLTDFVPPYEIINLAQLVLGTTIGCSFAGTAFREIRRIFAMSIGTTVILLAITLVFAVVLNRLSPFETTALLLAYSPGGLAEMSLIALALQLEVAFVAAHHIVRLFLVLIGAEAVFTALARLRRSPS
ncbi:AbrB family transcriptional regulator [Microvirga massiliensis]|uniref:AbrB family transcriptional regulator n=1 Tax=Microvirga massiliensis TaxID=1033741 RepID=UPI00065FA918|nr:AbrB family transcriptional regulator [Microvirga massiliensis]